MYDKEINLDKLSLYIEENEVDYNTYSSLYRMLYSKLTGNYLVD